MITLVPRRFLNFKSIAVIATLLFVVTCYFAVKKVMASIIQLGMERATVIQLLGDPTDETTMIQAEVWEKVLISKNIYQQIILVDFDKSGRANFIAVLHVLFGHHLMETRR